MKLELFKMLQTRTRFFLIYHVKRISVTFQDTAQSATSSTLTVRTHLIL